MNIKKKYIGEVYNNEFIIEPPVNFFYSPAFQVQGEILENKSSIFVNLKFKLPSRFAIVLLLGFLACSIIIPFIYHLFQDDTINSRFLPLLIMIPFLAYFVTIISFNVELNLFIKRFSNVQPWQVFWVEN